MKSNNASCSTTTNYVTAFRDSSMGNFVFGEYGNETTIKDAVKLAYIDMQPRTIKGHGNFEKPKEESAEWWAKRLVEYFKKPKETRTAFESWHQKVCSDYLQFYKTKYKYELSFGKAQKILNMTFKYLYCGWRENHPEAFAFCHMPLDSIILNWYRIRIDEKQKTAWSNLDYDEYSYIEERINNYLKNKNMRPIHAEFEIWHLERQNKKLSDGIRAISQIKSCLSLRQDLGKMSDDIAVYLSEQNAEVLKLLP